MVENSILIISPNWIGDAVMSMPAVQIFRQENRDVKITVMARPGILDLWRMNPAVDYLVECGKGRDQSAVIKEIRKTEFRHAYILPNSFRSAYIPFRARIPKRTGAQGHWRKWMLTKIIRLGEGHQQFEAMNILGVQGDPPPPRLDVPEAVLPDLGPSPIVTLLPGASRGPSKRWPPDRFAALAKRLQNELNATVVLSGGPDDAESCGVMANETGSGVLNLAGKTSVAEWAALLKKSDCVVANDSGGMHLASAVGTPVAAIFGITDPKKTGPLGPNIILQKSDVQKRDIARHSEEAVEALSAVHINEVFEAVQKLLSEHLI